MVRPVSRAPRSRFSGLRITRGALVVAGLELGLSLIYQLLDPSSPAGVQLASWVAPTADGVFRQGRVWTLATGAFLEPDILALVLHMMVLWMFVPTLERFWGTARFYRFVAITSLAGSIAGCAFGLLVGDPRPVVGLDPFIYASIVAFGIVYARQPVQFFGVLPLTGRQLMYGILGFLVLYIVLQQFWMRGVAFSAAMLAAAILTSKRFRPGLAWKRWRIARARARLTVMSGGKAHAPPTRDEHKWLN